MSYTFEAEYTPGQAVTIIALERGGFVDLVRVHEGGVIDYFVEWWDEGKRCEGWLPARELRDYRVKPLAGMKGAI